MGGGEVRYHRRMKRLELHIIVHFSGSDMNNLSSDKVSLSVNRVKFEPESNPTRVKCPSHCLAVFVVQ